MDTFIPAYNTETPLLEQVNTLAERLKATDLKSLINRLNMDIATLDISNIRSANIDEILIKIQIMIAALYDRRPIKVQSWQDFITSLKDNPEMSYTQFYTADIGFSESTEQLLLRILLAVFHLSDLMLEDLTSLVDEVEFYSTEEIDLELLTKHMRHERTPKLIGASSIFELNILISCIHSNRTTNHGAMLIHLKDLFRNILYHINSQMFKHLERAELRPEATFQMLAVILLSESAFKAIISDYNNGELSF